MKEIEANITIKLSCILEIIIEMFNCSFSEAYSLIHNTLTFKAIISGDKATLYQSASCCVEDIGKELRDNQIKAGYLFTKEHINNSIMQVRKNNTTKKQLYKQKINMTNIDNHAIRRN